MVRFYSSRMEIKMPKHIRIARHSTVNGYGYEAHWRDVPNSSFHIHSSTFTWAKTMKSMVHYTIYCCYTTTFGVIPIHGHGHHLKVQEARKKKKYYYNTYAYAYTRIVFNYFQCEIGEWSWMDDVHWWPAGRYWMMFNLLCMFFVKLRKKNMVWYTIYIYVTHTSVCRLDLAEFGVLFRAVNISVNIMAWPGLARPDRTKKVDRLTMHCAVTDTFNTLIKWFWKMKRYPLIYIIETFK